MQQISIIKAAEVIPDAPQSPAEFKALLMRLSRTDALLHCVRLNLSLTSVEKVTSQASLFPHFFTEKQIDRINDAATRISSDHPSGQIGIFHRGQLLELMRWICLLCEDHADDGSTFEEFSTRQAFATAALVAGDLWSRRVYQLWGDPDGSARMRENLYGPLRQAAAESYPSKFDILQGFGRANLLMRDHLPKRYPNFEPEFYEKTGLSIEEYYSCLFTIVALCLETPENPEPYYVVKIEDIRKNLPHISPILDRYLQLESQTVDDLRVNLWGRRGGKLSFDDPPPYNFKVIRERPILRFSDDSITVIDPILYMETASVGPLFHILRGKDRQYSVTVSSAFGLAFEDYVNNLLRRMYPQPKLPLEDRLVLNPKARTSEKNDVEVADGFLQDVEQGVLYECKAKWIRDDIVLGDQNKFISHLRKQYRNDRGEFQLARSIQKLSTEEWQPIAWNLHLVKRIFPLLISHDTLLNAFGYADFFAREFYDELEPESRLDTNFLKKGKFHVAHLVVVTIDVLETLEKSIEKFSLCKLLQEYLEFRSSRDNPIQIDSLRAFIGSTDWQQHIETQNNTVIQKAMELLNEVVVLIDPSGFTDEADAI